MNTLVNVGMGTERIDAFRSDKLPLQTVMKIARDRKHRTSGGMRLVYTVDVFVI